MIAQIFAVLIFLVMFFLIITEILPRHFVTLFAGILTIILVFTFGMNIDNFYFGKNYNVVESIKNTLNLHGIFTLNFWYSTGESESGGVNWATILFIVGMMIMVEGMARVGFFRWLCMCIAKAVKYKIIPIFISFMLISFVLAMFIDSITVILFLAAVTVELSKMLKFNPLSMVLAEIFCANLGGSATMCGDPPNIIIGTSLNLTFLDFVMNTGLIAAISLIVTIIYFFLTCKKFLVCTENVDTTLFPSPKEAITDKKGFIFSTIIFIIAVILLVTHSTTHFSVAAIGVFIAILTLICGGKHIREILKKVDWQTVIFFIGLFIVVGGLEQTGILILIAQFIQKISGGNAYLMIAILIWVSAIASAFIDNIPFAATMVPVIQALAKTTGIALPTMAYALAMGTDIGGSATPIGASANVVGTSMIAKAGHPVSWGKYCKISAPATIIVLAISTFIIFIRYL